MDFTHEFQKLLSSQPRSALNHKVVVNGTYGDYLFRCKNIYLGFFLRDTEDAYYSHYLANCRDVVDCNYLSGSELSYECVDSMGLYDCAFLTNCQNCSRSRFCFSCINCQDCFGCFGLKHQKFRIFNKPYSEQEYQKKLEELKKVVPEKILQILQAEFDKFPRLGVSPQNSLLCFDAPGADNSAYFSDAVDPTVRSVSSYDCDFSQGMAECYDCLSSENCENCRFLENCSSCFDSEYLQNCYGCRNCFGCAYLENKEYCILNRQFKREEYEFAVAKIKAELKEKSAYGKTLVGLLEMQV